MRKPYVWLVLAVVLLAGFLRLYHLASTPPGLYPDEAMNGNNALEALRTGNFKVYYPENNGREGLFIGIQAQVLRVFVLWNHNAPDAWMLRLPSAIVGILTVLLMYFLGKELFSKRAGLAASFFLAVSFWHLNFSRIGFRAIMAPFFIIAAAYFFLRAIKRSESGTSYWPSIIAGGIAAGFGFYTYIAYRVAPFALLAFAPFMRKAPRFSKLFLAYVAITFVVALPIGAYYLKHPGDFLGRTSEISIFGSGHAVRDLAQNTIKTLAMFNVKGDSNWRHNFSGAPELYWPVGLLFLFGVAMLIWRSAKTPDTRPGASFLLSLFILGLLPVVVSDEGIPHALRSILLIPPVLLAAGYGAAALYDILSRRMRRGILIACVAVVAAVLAAQTYDMYFVRWGENPEVAGAFTASNTMLARAINTLPPEIPKYIVVDAGGVLVRGIPMPSQTVMYLTDSYLPDGQARKNIHYLLPQDASAIPANAVVFHIR